MTQSEKTLAQRIGVIMWISDELQKSEYNSQKQGLAYNALASSGVEMVEIIQSLVGKLEIAEKALQFYEKQWHTEYDGVEHKTFEVGTFPTLRLLEDKGDKANQALAQIDCAKGEG